MDSSLMLGQPVVPLLSAYACNIQASNDRLFQHPREYASGQHSRQQRILPSSQLQQRAVQTQVALTNSKSPNTESFQALSARNTNHEQALSDQSGSSSARFQGSNHPQTALVDPPDLQTWRERLFNVEDTLVLTEKEYNTYFPHVDNIYSHRSSQRHKKHMLVAHYWDCRLKGRPPGTKKTDDPNKRKRKRVARERDQCDMKLKIVEISPGADILVRASHNHSSSQSAFAQSSEAQGTMTMDQTDGITSALSETVPALALPAFSIGGTSIAQTSALGDRIYTIQRIDSNTGNSGHMPTLHKHTLAYSDQIKNSSVIRARLRLLQDKKRRESSDDKKSYHTKASGNALKTVKAHSDEHDLKLYGSCFCPFVQRVWISLELKQIPYQYIEVDPYQKPKSLLEVNPRGLVPALRHGDWGCAESTVLMEYLEDLNQGTALLPQDPKLRAHSRLWSDHVNRNIIPSFYHYLQAQQSDVQIKEASTLKEHISTLVSAADAPGPFFLGASPSFVDIQLAPWILRLSRVLKPYRAWPDAEPNSRWKTWVDAIEADTHVQATTSDDVLYLESYQRYAENRPNTSQLAKAVNEGRGLP